MLCDQNCKDGTFFTEVAYDNGDKYTVEVPCPTHWDSSPRGQAEQAFVNEVLSHFDFGDK